MTNLREFAKRKFGSLAGLAHAIEVTPQSLNPYFHGRKQIGEALAAKLAKVGFESKAYSGLQTLLDIEGLEQAIGRPLSVLLPTLGVPAEQAEAWRRGEAVQSDQLVRVTNLLIATVLGRQQALASLPYDQQELKENLA